MGRVENSKLPVASVKLVLFRPVSKLKTPTSAPLTAAPLESATIPSTVPTPGP